MRTIQITIEEDDDTFAVALTVDGYDGEQDPRLVADLLSIARDIAKEQGRPVIYRPQSDLFAGLN
jgi:hypothetical protein